ncbi:DUF2489 domain-containing protein [Marinomonas agarivorans]|nr:DUF2489 domain-containing protein [Marinomonas agarivorans]
MSTSFTIILIIVGVIAIFALSRVILSLLKKERARAKQIALSKEKQQQAREDMVRSIHILLNSVGSEELGWIEASIRIKHLLDLLSFDLSEHKSIYIFYKIYAETEHIPTHDAWSALPKKAKDAFRKTFSECEEKYALELEQGKKDLLLYPLHSM